MTAPNDVHILLVDDEVLTRKVVGNLLRKCGYRGVQACHVVYPAAPARSSISVASMGSTVFQANERASQCSPS